VKGDATLEVVKTVGFACPAVRLPVMMAMMMDEDDVDDDDDDGGVAMVLMMMRRAVMMRMVLCARDLSLDRLIERRVIHAGHRVLPVRRSSEWYLQ
jgi:hypothetical protein